MKHLLLLFFSFCSISLLAQVELDDRANLVFHDGWGFMAKDSSVMMNLRFRIQNRFQFDANVDDFSEKTSEAKVRRLRLRMDGFVANKKLGYLFQIGFSREDLDWDNSNIPMNIRDAMIFIPLNTNWQLSFGQGKLPGNRQTMISSGSQQFAERSSFNSTFSLDRDFGVFLNYSTSIGKSRLHWKNAISDGEGRNMFINDVHYSYTSRVEFLPLGRFTSNGDFIEGDLMKENKPKISIAVVYNYNDNAHRTFGQRGKILENTVDMQTTMAEVLIKYNGFASNTEVAKKNLRQSPFTFDQEANPVVLFTGDGLNEQLSYFWGKGHELGLRYTFIQPYKKIASTEYTRQIYMLGYTRYLNKHQVKIQCNAYYQKQYNASSKSDKNNIGLIFQMELGI